MKNYSPRLFLLTLALLANSSAFGQQCHSGAVSTNDAYLYGRFETRMQSAPGDGIVSSFFLYNVDLNCNWPAENNELDIEMTGNRDASVQFTTHYPGPWSVTEIVPTPFNPHQSLHDYAFEWEPGIVRWFVDGELSFEQSASHINNLMYPMRILMNLWAADSPSWVGPWDPSVMPQTSRYDYVRYYAYTPGTGNTGTNNNYTLEWSDNFDNFDENRWTKSDFTGFGNNFCTFVSANVATEQGELTLQITEPLTPTFTEVSFSVDMNSETLLPGDIVYVNGTFNNWCGNCTPMSDTDGDGVWEKTLNLPSGKHEYLYTINGWTTVGSLEQGSSCDFTPCDEFANYGFVASHNASAIETETYCWASCESCASTSTDADNDDVTDEVDNCLAIANPTQTDTDNDGYGNVCDIDFNNDCVTNFLDVTLFSEQFQSTNPLYDINDDGVVNFIDFSVVGLWFLQPPGPGQGSCD